jgi:hypothetical protein
MHLPGRIGPIWHRGVLGAYAGLGEVFEQPIDVADGAGGVHRLRRIVLQLDRPTRDGETEIVPVTDLPAEVTALAYCAAYAGRWQIEGHY